VGPRSGLDAVAKRKIPCLCRESNPGRPAHSLVAAPPELSRLLHYRKVYLKVSGLAAWMVQLSATNWNFIATLWVSLVSFAAITLCVASQRVFIFVSVHFVVGSVRIHPRIVIVMNEELRGRWVEVVVAYLRVYSNQGSQGCGGDWGTPHGTESPAGECKLGVTLQWQLK
jgi:hypothetical protein